MISILGANGNVGRSAAHELQRQGIPVKLVTRAQADLRDLQSLLQALQGSTAVLAICPLEPQAADVEAAATQLIETLCQALKKASPAHILAISDYGAQHPGPTGLPSIFRRFEQELEGLGLPCTILRSAEHMQNWLQFRRAAESGSIPWFYPANSRPFVSAPDLGRLAAELLAAAPPGHQRVIHAEGPQRYTAAEVAEAFSRLLDRPVRAESVPQQHWPKALSRAGLGSSYAALLAATFQSHAAGLIEPSTDGELRRCQTSLFEALRLANPTMASD